MLQSYLTCSPCGCVELLVVCADGAEQLVGLNLLVEEHGNKLHPLSTVQGTRVSIGTASSTAQQPQIIQNFVVSEILIVGHTQHPLGSATLSQTGKESMDQIKTIRVLSSYLTVPEPLKLELNIIS